MDGMSNAGVVVPGLTATDVDVAFYGNIFRESGAKNADDLPLPEEVTSSFETDLLYAWWEGAASREPDLVESPRVLSAKAPVPRSVQHMMSALSQSRSMTAIAQRFLLGSLRQVNRYLNEGGIREQVQERVRETVTDDTRVLVGHSLVSVVAYEALCAHPEWSVSSLVTVGSPLGIRNLVFDRLCPTPVAGRGMWPGVRSWTNVCDAYDIVALVKELGPQFDVPGGWRRVQNKSVNNGWKAHDLVRHLTDAETGKAVAAGLDL